MVAAKHSRNAACGVQDLFDRAKLQVGVPCLVSQPSSLLLLTKRPERCHGPSNFGSTCFLFHCNCHWPSFLLALFFFFCLCFFVLLSCFILLSFILLLLSFIVLMSFILLFLDSFVFSLFLFLFLDFFLFPPLFWLSLFSFSFSFFPNYLSLPFSPTPQIFLFPLPFSFCLLCFRPSLGLFVLQFFFRFLSSALSLSFVLSSSSVSCRIVPCRAVPCRPRAPLRSRAAAPRSSHAAAAAVPHISASQRGAGAAERQQISARRPVHKKGGRQQAPSLRRRQDAP